MAAPSFPASAGDKGLQLKQEKLKALVDQAEKSSSNAASIGFLDILWDLPPLFLASPNRDKEVTMAFVKLLTRAAEIDVGGAARRLIVASLVSLYPFDATSALMQVQRTYSALLANPRSAVQKLSGLSGIAVLFGMRGGKVANLASDSTIVALRFARAPEPSVLEGAGTHVLPQLADVLKNLRAILAERNPGTVSGRLAAAECLMAVARIPLSREQQEPLVNTASKAWDDPAFAVRAAAASALGVGVALAVQRPQRRKKDPQAQNTIEWTIESAIEFFSTQMMRATSREMRAAAALALVAFTKGLKADFLQRSLSSIVTSVMTFLQVLSLLSRENLRALPSASDIVHTRQLVCYILRTGMSSVLDEVGQLAMVKLLVAFVRKHAANEQVAAASLQELSALVTELGEGVAPSRDSVVDAVTALFSSTSREVRLKAALCLRHVGAAVPSLLAALLSTCTSTANMAHAEIANSKGSEAIRQQLAALEGAGLAAAGLLASVPQCPMGIPHQVRKFAYKTARALLLAPQPTGTLGEEISMTRKEVGWAIIGSMMLLGQSYIERKMDGDISELLKMALSMPVSGELSPSGYRQRSFAMAVLVTFLQKYGDSLLTAKLTKDFVNSLAIILRAVPRDQPDASILKVQMMKAFSLLQPAAYSTCLSDLIRSCTAELAYGAPASISPLARNARATDETFVDPATEDPVKKDPLEEYFPQPGAPPATEPFLILAPDIEDTLSLVPALAMTVQLTDSAAELFPVLFASQAEKNRTQLVEYFIGQLAKTQGKERVSLATNACVALVGSLRYLNVHKRPLLVDASAAISKLPASLQDMFLGMLGDESASLRRSAAEGLGLLSAVDGERYMERVLTAVIGIIRANKERIARAAAATALGSIARCTTALRAGGQVLATLVGTLHSLVRDEVASLHTEALHALRMTTDAAGPAFCGFASPTLSLLHSLLVSDAHDHPAALQAIGNALNAVVAAMGPELQVDSPTVRMCNAICDQLKTHDDPEVTLQSIQNRQMLVLFAPQTINVASLQPMLKKHLISTHASLRLAGVVCLRQLLSTHPETIGTWRLDEQLLQMYDSEREPAMRRELMLLLSALMDLLCGRAPNAWLALFKRIVGSNQRTAASEDDLPKPAVRSNEEEGDEDEGGGLAGKRGPAEKSEEETIFNPRLRTKLFAIEGVRRVIALASESKVPAHFNLQLARVAQKSGKGDQFLVLSLADIVSMAFRTGTSNVEAVRPAGIGVIKDLVEKFADQLDADVEGVGILDQYQAQIASALKPAFAPDAFPLVTCAACQTVLPFLNSNISLDNGILKRLVTLLAAKVEKVREINFSNYSEVACTRVQIAVLFTLAQLRIHSHKAKLIADSIALSLPLLRSHWIALLRDYAVLTNTNPPARKAYKPAFFSRTTSVEVLPHFRGAWPAVLEAAASLVDSPVWMQGRDDKSLTASLTKPPNGAPPSDPSDSSAVMLRESTPSDDHWLLLGLALQHMGLQGYYTPLDAVAALKACRLALPPNVLQQKELFPLSLCQDIASGLHTLVSHGEGEVRGSAVRLAAHLLCSLPHSFFQSAEELALYSSLFELLFAVLASPPSPPADPMSLVDALTAVAALAPLILPSQALHYLPLLLNSLVTVFPALSAAPVLKTSLDSAFKAVLSAIEWEGKAEILTSTLHELLLLTGKELEGAAPAILGLLEDSKEPLSASLAEQASSFVNAMLATPHMRLSILQWLRAQIAKATSAPQSPASLTAYQLLESASPALCSSLARFGSDIASADQLVEVKEVAGLMILAYNSAPQPKKEPLLTVAMPLLVGLLRPDQKRVAQHDLAIQLLLHLATAATADFRLVLSRLPTAERQKLETALRAAMQNAAPAAAPAAETEKKSLRLDFSRYQ